MNASLRPAIALCGRNINIPIQSSVCALVSVGNHIFFWTKFYQALLVTQIDWERKLKDFMRSPDEDPENDTEDWSSTNDADEDCPTVFYGMPETKQKGFPPFSPVVGLSNFWYVIFVKTIIWATSVE